MTQDHDAVRMLLGAYVLGGLDAADRRTVEDHLPNCVTCRDEVAELVVESYRFCAPQKLRLLLDR